MFGNLLSTWPRRLCALAILSLGLLLLLADWPSQSGERPVEERLTACELSSNSLHVLTLKLGRLSSCFRLVRSALPLRDTYSVGLDQPDFEIGVLMF